MSASDDLSRLLAALPGLLEKWQVGRLRRSRKICADIDDLLLGLKVTMSTGRLMTLSYPYVFQVWHWYGVSRAGSQGNCSLFRSVNCFSHLNLGDEKGK